MEVIENMITYFYTFDYDDAANLASQGQHRDKRKPLCSLEMNAWMYAIAEKYEVPCLKALALEKFKAHANVTDKQSMFCAAQTIYDDIPLPVTDQVLHRLIEDMWLLGGRELMENMREMGVLCAVQNLDVFATNILGKYMGGSTTTVKQFCKSCNRYEVFKREEVTTKAFVFKACKCTETKKAVEFSSSFTIDRYW